MDPTQLVYSPDRSVESVPGRTGTDSLFIVYYILIIGVFDVSAVLPADSVLRGPGGLPGRSSAPYWNCDDDSDVKSSQVGLYPAFNSSTGNPYTGAVFKSCSLDGLHPYYIPGLGDVTSELCGSVRHLHRCPECLEVRLHYYQCHNYSCPTCYGSAAHQAAERIEDRVSGIGCVLRLNGVKTRYPNHIIISPPVNTFQPGDDIRVWRKRVYDVARSIGVIGAAVVFHPYRIYDEIKEQLRSFNGGDDSGGLWSLIHKNVLGLESWREYVEWSPHFHLIGFMPNIKIKSDVLESETGFVYKVVKYQNSNDSGRMYSVPNIKAVVNYLLTHHAYIDGSVGYTYFGVLSYNKAAVVAKERHIESIRCPVCDCVLEKWVGFGVNDDGSIDLSGARNCGDAEYVREWSVFKVHGLDVMGSVFGVYNPDVVDEVSYDF